VVDWRFFNNIMHILLKSISHFESNNVYGGTYIIGCFLIIYVAPYGLVDLNGGLEMVYNNITYISLKSIRHFECSDMYRGTYIIGGFLIIYVPT